MRRDGFESGCLLSHAVRSPMADMRMPLKTAWPGVVPADVEVANLDEVAGKYPAVAADLRAIAASVQHVAPTGVGPR